MGRRRSAKPFYRVRFPDGAPCRGSSRAEHPPCKRKVGGAIPLPGSIKTMAKKRISKEALYDFMERLNPVIEKIFIHGPEDLKKKIGEIGFSLNSNKNTLTRLLTQLEEWVSDVLSHFPNDKTAKEILNEIKDMSDRNPHTEWRH